MPSHQDNPSKKVKALRRRLRLFLMLPLALLTLWGTVKVVDYLLLENNIQAQNAILEQDLFKQRELNMKLKQQLRAIEDPEMIEQKARELEMMGRPGDTIYLPLD